jgi:hypothetical protein
VPPGNLRPIPVRTFSSDSADADLIVQDEESDPQLKCEQVRYKEKHNAYNGGIDEIERHPQPLAGNPRAGASCSPLL